METIETNKGETILLGKDGAPNVTWSRDLDLIQWKGFYLTPEVINFAIPQIETQFKPLKSDILLASFPKTGTTWLKALTATILNLHSSTINTNPNFDPLLTHNPHELVPFLELDIFREHPVWDIEKMSSPRVFSTHLPYSILPDHVKTSGCRIVYISRGPADTFVSQWHFHNKIFDNNVSIERAFEEFCNGLMLAGPFFDHVLEYWKMKDEENVFFVTYEELKQDPLKHVEKLADFLGCPLDSKEIEQVVNKCDIERLSKLDVNNVVSAKVPGRWGEFSSYFRRGVVGDSKNYLTAEMEERIDRIAKEKWQVFGRED